MSFKIKLSLFFFRFFAWLLILTLLLNPYIEKEKKIIEDPVFVIFQDNSSSIISNSDSLYYKKNYLQLMNELISKISKKVDVKFLLFGENIRKDTISFRDQFSDISAIFNYSEGVFSNLNVAGYLLASDGIFNKGDNPDYLEKYLNAPLYCLALGDTSKIQDVSIHTLDFNKIGFPDALSSPNSSGSVFLSLIILRISEI